MRDSLLKGLIGIHLAMLFLLSPALPQTMQADPAVEKRVIDYLAEQVKTGKPVAVSELYNTVFTGEEERKALDRLFNVFFKIPAFVAQYKTSTGRIPTLDDIAQQFSLRIPGEVETLLAVMEKDPRIPKFIARDPESGEITSVDVEAIESDKRFNQEIERSLGGWLGREVPAFALDLLDGGRISSADLKGKYYLIYFWYSACPPCVRTSPLLVRLYEKFQASNFTIVAVNADRLLALGTTDEERTAYVKEQAIRFPVAHLNKEMQQNYGNVNVYPTFFLVDSRGIIRKHYIGYQPPQVLTGAVESLLKGK